MSVRIKEALWTEVALKRRALKQKNIPKTIKKTRFWMAVRWSKNMRWHANKNPIRRNNPNGESLLGPAGIEPATKRLWAASSTAELRAHIKAPSSDSLRILLKCSNLPLQLTDNSSTLSLAAFKQINTRLKRFYCSHFFFISFLWLCIYYIIIF